MTKTKKVKEIFINPTPAEPVFIASCSYLGTIEANAYKSAKVDDMVYSVFHIDYTEAINDLHFWIKDHEQFVKSNIKVVFELEAIDGTKDKYGTVKRKKVYSISGKKAKKYLL